MAGDTGQHRERRQEQPVAVPGHQALWSPRSDPLRCTKAQDSTRACYSPLCAMPSCWRLGQAQRGGDTPEKFKTVLMSSGLRV